MLLLANPKGVFRLPCRYRQEINPKGSPMMSSSSVATKGKILPIVDCPKCKISVLRLRCKSSSKDNDKIGSIFYKCPNNFKDDKTCYFFKWEDEYELYLQSLNDSSSISKELSDYQIGDKDQNSEIAFNSVSNELSSCYQIGEVKKQNANILAMLSRMQENSEDQMQVVIDIERILREIKVQNSKAPRPPPLRSPPRTGVSPLCRVNWSPQFRLCAGVRIKN